MKILNFLRLGGAIYRLIQKDWAVYCIQPYFSAATYIRTVVYFLSKRGSQRKNKGGLFVLASMQASH